MITAAAGAMTALNTFGLFKDVLEKVKDAKEYVPDLPLTAAERAVLSSQGSITRLLAPFIISPTIIVSKDLRTEPTTEKLVETNIDIFSSFYVQAFNILSSLYGFTPVTSFNLLSSQGSIGGPSSYASRSAFGMEESIGLDLEFPVLPINDGNKTFLGFEAYGDQNKRNKLLGRSAGTSTEENEKNPISKAALATDKSNISTLISKELEISISVAKNGETVQTIKIPVTIRANIIYTDFANIQNLVAVNSRETKYSYRIDEWLSGGIAFWKDFIFATDLVKQYKESKLKDKDDLIGYMNDRKWSSNEKLVTSKAMGYGKYYSMLIISNREKATIENKLGGKLTQEKYKDMLLTDTASLSVNVMDLDREQVVIFTKDIPGVSNASFRAISKRKGDKDGSELGEIFKAILNNRPPVL